MKKNLLLAGAIGLSGACFAQDSTAHKLKVLMDAYAQTDRFTGSVLVARKGTILLSQGYGWKDREARAANDAGTVYQIASVTKTFTASLVLKLVQLKKLSLQDKLSRFYPGYPKGDSITIEHLLTHTSGIYDYASEGDDRGINVDQPRDINKTMEYFSNKPFRFSPGTGWGYSNSGYFLLGCIIQQVTGLSYEQAMRRFVFEPTAMHQSGFDFIHLANKNKACGYYADSTGQFTQKAVLADSTGPFAAGAIYATVEDLYKWHSGLQSHQVLADSLQQQAYKPFRNRYGYGWIIDSFAGRKIVSHSGGIFGFRSDFLRIPADDVCVILLSNTEMPGLGNISRRILNLLYGLPYAVPERLTAVPVQEAILKKYVGTYKIASNGVLVEMVLENGRLISKPQKGPVVELLALNDTHFFLANEHEFRITFVMNAQAQVEKMIFNQMGRIGEAPKIK